MKRCQGCGLKEEHVALLPNCTAGELHTFAFSEYTVPHVEIRRTNEMSAPEGDVLAKGAASVEPMLREILGGREQESFVMLIVNGGGRVVGWREVARGLTDQVQVPVREMFRTALVCGARGLFIAHNHPSGDPTPSRQDIYLTRALREAGALIDCPIFDHVIIGNKERYFSFAGGGWQSSAQLPMGERQGPELDDD